MIQKHSAASLIEELDDAKLLFPGNLSKACFPAAGTENHETIKATDPCTPFMPFAHSRSESLHGFHHTYKAIAVDFSKFFVMCRVNAIFKQFFNIPGGSN